MSPDSPLVEIFSEIATAELEPDAVGVPATVDRSGE
jgi:hypothetical protein